MREPIPVKEQAGDATGTVRRDGPGAAPLRGSLRLPGPPVGPAAELKIAAALVFVVTPGRAETGQTRRIHLLVRATHHRWRDLPVGQWGADNSRTSLGSQWPRSWLRRDCGSGV